LRLRAAEAADRELARRIYLETTRPYVGHLPEWTDAFIVARFAHRFDVATTRMIELDGETIGWVRLSATGDEIVLEQLYLAPDRQGRGLGSALLRQLAEEWRHSAKPVTLRVLKENPARRLYERFGFHVTGETEIQYLMRRAPPAG
jgi:ribosomal protein S18 acetylase RimI-like enzyme